MKKELFKNYVEVTVKEKIGFLKIGSMTNVSYQEYKELVMRFSRYFDEYWCICRFCQMYDNKNKLFNFFINEFKDAVNFIKQLKIPNNLIKVNICKYWYFKCCELYKWENIKQSIYGSTFLKEFCNEEQMNAICKDLSSNLMYGYSSYCKMIQ